MRVSRIAAVLAVVTASLLPGVSHARPAPLIVTAARSASVDVTFPKAVTLDTGHSTAAGGAEFSGYYFQPLAGKAEAGFGQVWFADFRYEDFTPRALPLGWSAIGSYASSPAVRWSVPAGRYRLHVFGDRRVEARLAVSGRLAGRRLTATRPTTVGAAAKDVTPSVAGRQTGLPGVVVDDLPLSAHPHSLSVSAVYTVRHSVATNATVADSCLGRADGLRCVAADGDAYAWQGYSFREVHREGPSAQSATTTAEYLAPGTLGAGPHKGYFEIASSAFLDRVAVAVFALRL